MTENINVAGVDHDTPLSIREKIAFTAEQAQSALDKLRQAGARAVIISTCNRTELWCDGADALEALSELKNVDVEALYTYEGGRAAAHLFRVSAGLESRLIGEDQILAQVKEAIELSQKTGASSPLLNQLFRCAVSAAKEVKTNVLLCGASLTAPRRAADMAKERLRGLAGKSALVIGSGTMGRMAAEILIEEKMNVSVTMRKVSHRRVQSAPIAGANYIDYDDRLLHIDESQVVVSATASPHYTLSCGQIEGALLGLGERVYIDLAVPRDIDPDIARLPGASLYDIDDIGGGEITGEAEAMEIWGRYEKRLNDWIDGRRAANSAAGAEVIWRTST